MERQYNSFHQSKQNRVTLLAEKTKSLVGASHQSKQSRVSPAEKKSSVASVSHMRKQTRVSPAGQKNSPVSASLQNIDRPSLHQIIQTKVTSSGKFSSHLGESKGSLLPCNGVKAHKPKESSHCSASFSKLRGKCTISECECRISASISFFEKLVCITDITSKQVLQMLALPYPRTKVMKKNCAIHRYLKRKSGPPGK